MRGGTAHGTSEEDSAEVADDMYMALTTSLTLQIAVAAPLWLSKEQLGLIYSQAPGVPPHLRRTSSWVSLLSLRRPYLIEDSFSFALPTHQTAPMPTPLSPPLRRRLATPRPGKHLVALLALIDASLNPAAAETSSSTPI